MANTLAAELILDISKFRRGLQNAQNAVNKSFGGGSAGGKVGNGIAAGITGSAAAITGALVAVLAVAAGIAAYRAAKIIAQGIALAGEHEKLQMRFEILTGSRGAGNRALNELREDALKTGVTLEDMADNVGKFMAFGFDPDKAMKLNKGILDVGGSVGLSTRDMKLLGVALSQVAAKGVASMEELRQQIAEKGIPIFKALEQQLGVTGAELSVMIQEGKVGADVVLDMFTQVPDGQGPFARFAGGAEKMGRTLPGIVSRMKTAWTEFLRVLGNPLVDALKPAMEAALKAMEGLVPLGARFGQALADAVSEVTAIGMVLSSLSWEQFGNLFKLAFIIAIKEIANHLIGMLAGVGMALGAYFIAAGQTLISLLAILAHPAFWVGMAKEFWNMATVFGEQLLSVTMKVIGWLRESAKGIWDALTGRGGAGIEPPDMGSFDDWLNGQPTKEDLIDAAVEGLAGQIEAATEAFKTGYDKGSNTFDSSKEQDDLLGQFKTMADKLKAQQRAATAERNRTDGEASVFGGSGATASGGGGASLNGVMSQAINVLSGRSAFAVIAESASRTEQTQKQIKEGQDKSLKVLDTIEKNTRPKNLTVNTRTMQDMSRFA
jgi:tape measure domain-containing protein